VVRAYAALMKLGMSGEVYNVGSGVGRSIRSLLNTLLSRSQANIRVETDAARLRPAETVALVGDTSRLRQRTGWTPQISFESMLDRLLEYWRANIDVPL
jgi:GDP-4-dehydro-6-deoxy-D-mannose reductase